MLKTPKKIQKTRALVLEPLEDRTLLAAPTLIDIMVVYDANSKTQLGVTDTGIQKLIRQSVDTANQAHYNTGDGIVLRLVYTGQVTYTSSGDFNTDLNNLKAGTIPNVNTLRNTYGADLVSLVSTPSSPSGVAGLATLPVSLDVNANKNANAFSVIRYDSIGPGSFTLAHETGHNLGAGHERGNGSGGLFSYSWGYTFNGNDGTQYGDVMSYAPNNVPYFSNPNLTYQGVPLGKPQANASSADLYDTFLQTGPAVSQYRTAVATDTSAPVPTLYQSDLLGSKLTFAVRYQDDVSVSAASLGVGDVYVHTPEGFILAADFVSLDSPGDGYAKVATYSVTLPNSNPPLSSLTYFINGGQVSDINGHTIGPSQIFPNTDFDIDTFAFHRARDTGTLAPGTIRTVTGAYGVGDTQDIYKFTVTQTQAISIVLSGLSASSTLFLFKDLNNNNVNNGGGEQLTNSFESGTDDRTIQRLLTPGTYYAYIQEAANLIDVSSYTLTLHGFTDSVPPTAIADAVDATTPDGPLVFSVLFTDNEEFNVSSIQSYAIIKLVLVGGVSGSGTTGSPDSINILSPHQIVANYSINFGSLPNCTVNLTIANSSQAKDAAGNLVPVGSALGSFKVESGVPDTFEPSAPFGTTPPVVVPGANSYDFTIAYKDNRAGVGATTVDSSDILVTGPKGFSTSAGFISSTESPGHSTRYATYRITPPGGKWDWHDNGTYTLNLQANQVKDAADLSVPADVVGTFTVHIPVPGDATNDDTVDFNDLVALAQSYNTAGKGVANGDFNYDGLVDFNDLVLLAQNYNTSPVPAALPQFSSAAVEVASKPLSKKPASVFSTTPVKKPAPAKPAARKPVR